MFQPQVKGKILKNIPSTLGDNGKVYDQYVFIELQDGTIIYLFDPEVISKDEGKTKIIEIFTNFSRIEKITDRKKGVESKYHSPEPDDLMCADKEPILFFGEIVGINEKWHTLYVDVDVGIIESGFCWDERESIKDYKIGDYVMVNGCRNDLTGVWDLYDVGGSGWVHIMHNHVNNPSGNQFLSFGPEYEETEKIKDLIMETAKYGVKITGNVYHYVEQHSGKTLRLIIGSNGYIVTAHPYTGFTVKDVVKEKTRVPVRILDMKPDAEYMEKAYTQLVLVEFANGVQALVFDDDMLCKPEMVGKNRKITLAMLVDSLEKIRTRDQSAVPDSSRPSLGINGRIEEIIIPDDPKDAERWHDAILDFGVGKILIEIDKKYFRLLLKEGDYVYVNGRVDLRDIE